MELILIILGIYLFLGLLHVFYFLMEGEIESWAFGLVVCVLWPFLYMEEDNFDDF